MRKRSIFAVVLVAFCLAAMLQIPADAQSAERDRGTCGKLTWVLNEDGTLTISGNGEMPESLFSKPWEGHEYFIKHVVIAEGITSISAYAFWECRNLIQVTIADSVTYIGESAFEGCDFLTDVDMPATLTGMGNSAFAGCKNLRMIQIPLGLSEIPSYAFSGCESLTKISIPYGVGAIWYAAFAGCTKLTAVSIPATAQYIENDAFSGCENLKQVYYGGKKTEWVRLMRSGDVWGEFYEETVLDKADVRYRCVVVGNTNWDAALTAVVTTFKVVFALALCALAAFIIVKLVKRSRRMF